MIKKPTLIVSESICRKNIAKMYSKAIASNTVLRPHFKTHQNITIGEWYREVGISKIAVSSVSMAKMFADQGWTDILIAFPFNPNEIEEIHNLANHTNLGLLVSCIDSAELASTIVKSSLDIYIKIDVGTHRTGFLPDNIGEISKALEYISSNKCLKFRGFVAHAGHTYGSSNHDEIRSIYRIGVGALLKLKKQFSVEFSDIIISWGDTPSCSIINDFEGVDEIRPGNFVFYDLMQHNINVCKPNEIALIVACPVVAKHTDRNEIVIYGGAVHLSKDSILVDGKNVFGLMVRLSNDLSWSFFEDNVYVDRISQEHGVIKVSNEIINELAIGDFIGIVPVHSCLTADLVKDFIFIA
ncbi:MAG: alanine racemase [Bacteroidetes bacterium]|nr:alanine racemase [Bacteroidota bacterium]